MVNVGGTSFDASHEALCLYGECYHTGVVAETKGVEYFSFITVNCEFLDESPSKRPSERVAERGFWQKARQNP